MTIRGKSAPSIKNNQGKDLEMGMSSVYLRGRAEGSVVGI